MKFLCVLEKILIIEDFEVRRKIISKTFEKWIFFLFLQIQDITFEQVDTSETKQAKDALLLWCQMKTAGYPNVNVRNFTTSWRDGLAFNAIIHKHRPDLIQYEKLSKATPAYNLESAFGTAEDRLGLTRLLDVEGTHAQPAPEISLE